jgi:uncharacterized paraquat-inducible protein A
MSLVHCRECGALNSSETEICLSCEHPIKGRAKTNLLRWAALLLIFCLGLPLALMGVDALKRQEPPQPREATPRV